MAVGGDTLYLGTGTLFSLNAGTGAVNWAHQVAEDRASAPVIGDGVVYVTGDSGLPQSFTPPSLASGTPAVADGLVFFGCGDNKLYAIRA